MPRVPMEVGPRAKVAHYRPCHSVLKARGDAMVKSQTGESHRTDSHTGLKPQGQRPTDGHPEARTCPESARKWLIISGAAPCQWPNVS